MDAIKNYAALQKEMANYSNYSAWGNSAVRRALASGLHQVASWT